MAQKERMFVIKIKEEFYDFLKFLALVGLPAVGTLYVTLAGIWGLPSAEQVVSTIVALDTFLGVILHLSSNTYNKDIEDAGELHVDEEGKLSFQLDGDKTDIDTLGDKKEVRFKIKKNKKKRPA